ncbi:hypothetical protein LXL04_029026 [Taraxacum kok-saghyz]
MSVIKQFEHLKIQLEDIKSATNNFAEDHLIGGGVFGKVYKGELLHWKGKTTVAFKRLHGEYGQASDSDMWKEIIMLSFFNHENIVSLLGFNNDSGEKFLVHEYASKGGLHLYLNNNDLTWVQRLKICIGAAHGLAYLHNPNQMQRVLPHDIKSCNILLDENWNAKIADLGLSKFGGADQNYLYLNSHMEGTLGYRDSRSVDVGILKESEIYSFGVVLFEVLCGRLCLDMDVNQNLISLVRKFYKGKNLEEIIHGSIKDELNPSSLMAFATIAYQCLTTHRDQRPPINIVVKNLETALTYQIFTDGLKIQLGAIQSATNNFAKDHCIGAGGFGNVYRGKLFYSGEHILVALKRLNRAFGQGNPEFWKEVNTLSRYRHENIVNLLGFCNERNEKILVYEYVPNRSLDLSLKNNDLTWAQRLKICIGAARGLAYLHNPDGNQESVWHLDIKSGNILLDENWSAKIADLGLSKFGHANKKYTSGTPDVVGTVGYCDPVYVETGSPSKESDVYSFGVVLFEVLSGRLCISNTNEHRSLIVLAQRCYEQNNLNAIIHRSIKYEISPSSLRVFTAIAYRCLKRDRGERPSMDQILKALNTALEYQVPPPLLMPSIIPPRSRSSREYQRALKPLHWEKTPAVEGSLWHDGIQSRAPKIDISELESLFCKHKYKAQPGYKQPKSENVRLVHTDRASNCEIVLHNIQLSLPDLMKAILELDSSAVSVDQVYNIIEICPTNEEMGMLKSYTGDEKKLGQCEQFFLECAKIPRIEIKLRVFAFTITFRTRVNGFKGTRNTIKDATKEIRESKKLVKIMQIILTMGNKLNAGTIQGSAQGFKLDSLEKLGDTYATDKNITLLHFLCEV